ncbi:LptF/LptG family permease [Gloeocapsopsis sp. IPPAS B-1203]|uniref:LptF/LptG family permease n=1 Tax=Gloeocapsopsis sp. IPPAS B-1203 TaxID=2049454 RepID=UPI0025A27B2D|nr:LptF/LptG family permease [Gloeocapsopsis sp. IPPAS B-1203]
MTIASHKFAKIPSLTLFSVMDRYIAMELLPPFLFGVGAFSSVGVAIGTLFDLVRRVVESGLPLEIALQVFLLQFPSFVVLAFPMSTLLAVLMTYGRFSSDSELIALRGCGISVYRIALPAIILSLVVTGITFLFNEQIVPASNYQATLTLNQALKRDTPTFQEENIIYPEYEDVEQADGERMRILSRLFYADRFDGQTMTGLTIIDRSKDGLNQIVMAENAAWNPQQNLWDFYDGTIYLVSSDSSYRNIVRFKHQQLQLPRAPLDISSKGRDYNEMNIAEARDRLEIIRFSGDEQKIRKLRVRIQEKIAFPFVCVVFGLVGTALGTKPQRRAGKATSFGVSVVIIFTYYLFSFISSALGVAGILTPVMSAWLPNLFGFTAGGLLLVRAAR